GVVAWLLFLSYRFASDAGETATRATLIGHGRIDGTLAFCLAMPGTIAAFGLIAHFTARSETAFRALSLLSLLAAGAVVLFLTAASHSLNGVTAFCLLIAWSWLAGEATLPANAPEIGLFRGGSRLVLAIGLGIAALSFSFFALSLAGVVSDLALGGVLAGGAILSALRLARCGKLRPGSFRWHGPRLQVDVLGLVAFLTVATGTIIAFGASLAPQSSFDALHYHLAMARAILEQGHFVE